MIYVHMHIGKYIWTWGFILNDMMSNEWITMHEWEKKPSKNNKRHTCNSLTVSEKAVINGNADELMKMIILKGFSHSKTTKNIYKNTKC